MNGVPRSASDPRCFLRADADPAPVAAGFCSTLASSCASCSVNCPVIWPFPPSIGPLMTGAERSSPSSTMASCRCTFSARDVAEDRGALRSERKTDFRQAELAARHEGGFDATCPSTQVSFLPDTRAHPGPPALCADEAAMRSPVHRCPAAPGCRSRVHHPEFGGKPPSESWFRALSLSASDNPGSWIRMRSAPAGWITGSATPNWSTRAA